MTTYVTDSGLEVGSGTAPTKHEFFGGGGVPVSCYCSFLIFFLLCVPCWYLLAETPVAEIRRLMKIFGRKFINLRKFSPTSVICFVNRKEDIY